MKFSPTLTQLVQSDMDNNVVPALMGEPGIGKSSFMEALATSLGTKCFVLPCNQLADKADLTGGRLVPITDAAGTVLTYTQKFFPHFTVQEAVDYAIANPHEEPILFLDEFNRTQSDITSAVLTLVTLRALGSVKLPSNLKIAVAGNDRGNVTALDEASLSRFAIYHVEPDATTLLSILGDSAHPYITRVLTANPNLVFCKSKPVAIAPDGDDDEDGKAIAATVQDMFDAGEEMLQLTTPRTIDYTNRWLNKIDPGELQMLFATPAGLTDRPDVSLLQEVLEGKLGRTDFVTVLMGEIATGITSNNIATPTVQAIKPASYDALKAATSITDLENQVAALPSREQGFALVYALSESTDNTRLIQTLAASVADLEVDQKRSLISLLNAGGLNRRNADAFQATATPLAQQMSGLFTII